MTCRNRQGTPRETWWRSQRLLLGRQLPADLGSRLRGNDGFTANGQTSTACPIESLSSSASSMIASSVGSSTR
jgi:hypothetical protein